MIPPLQSFKARDTAELFYRDYGTKTDLIVILVHGISEDSGYLYPLAHFLSSQGLARVVTPDLRGYVVKAVRKGDVDYIDQHLDDLADLIHHLSGQNREARFVLAGHSAGGGTVIRFAKSRHSDLVHAYLLLAPLLGPGAPTDKPSDGTISMNVKRLVALMILNVLGIRRWHGLPVMRIHRPDHAESSGRLTELSFRLLLSRTPMNYRKDLRHLTKPALFVSGIEDEVFRAEQYPTVFASYSKAEVILVPGETHDGILASREAHERIRLWIEQRLK